MEPSQRYNDRLKELAHQKSELIKRKSVFGALRLGVIIGLIVFFYFLWHAGWMYVSVAVIGFLALFIWLVKKHLANNEALQHVEALIKVNELELRFLTGNHWLFNDGNTFKPHTHDYAEDLDILGPYSLFQFVNRAKSEPGERLLANWLLKPADRDRILERQQAAKELRQHLPFLQDLQARGMVEKIADRSLAEGNSWVTEPTQFLQFRPWQILRYLLPALAVGTTIAYIADVVAEPVFYTVLFLMAVVAFQVNKYVSPIHQKLSATIAQASVLENTIRTIEAEKFQSPFLKDLQLSILSGNIAASQNIRQLKKMLDRLDLRYNILISFFLNIFLQWNLQQMLDLEKWKTTNTETFDKWFSTIAGFEAISSLAVLHINFPEWAFPEFSAEYFSIHARQLGHPFIAEEKRVTNDLEIGKREEIMLVTGSNMAGKSTYLRSVGVNVVLAMAGAPVCAKSFRLFPVKTVTSMRISDNLEESTSTFYAELKKLKNIIDKVNAGEEVFILLDEILRGTNTHDRHAGAEALIKQLLKKQAPAIIATHDIGLTSLATQYPESISNFHFDVQVSGEELFFDYKLKPGICTSMNASILMKKIGIEIGEE